MKIQLLIAITTLLFSTVSAQNKLTTDTGHVSFFANAPVSDVDARNEHAKMQLDTRTNALVIDMKMSEFKFKSEKMEKDARTKYLETGKFNTASFNGTLEGQVNYKKAGSYPVVASGKMKLHGVEKNIKEKGTVTVGAKGEVTLKSNFILTLNEFNIDTPEILGKKMTEENVKVSIEGTLK